MKRTLLAALAAGALCMGLLTGCAQRDTSTNTSQDASGATAEPERISVVCTSFSAYDWTRQIAGDELDHLDVTYLLDSGVDLHSYQPTVADMTAISDADLFLYVGGESEGWVEDAIKGAGDRLHTVGLLDTIGSRAVEEELVEGMQPEDEEAEEAEGGEEELDEHVWLSLRNAEVIVDAIAQELSAIDPASAATYAANAEAYKLQLGELDSRYADAVGAGTHDVVVFADRFPFRYLVDDYGLRYYAAFVGCSAETEASFETVAFLAKQVDELDLPAVLVIEGSDRRIAQTVVETTTNANQQILTMDSLQSVSAADIEGGKTYLSAMEANLATLAAALG